MIDKARILFVDDEKRVLNSMRGLFRREFDLFLTTEGSDAVRIASENAIDVVVADQRMPGMTGIEVLGKFKEMSPRTVRILLTGYADPEAVEGSINIGEVFRFLSKPCPPQMLRDTIKLAVNASRIKAAPVVQKSNLAPPSVATRPVNSATSHAAITNHQRGIPAASNASAVPTLVPLAEGQRSPSPLRPARSAFRQRKLNGHSPFVDAASPAASAVGIQANGTGVAVTKFSPDRRANTSPMRAVPRPAQGSSPASNSHWENATSIVLSGDTSHEFPVPNFAMGSASIVKSIGVVFFTVDPTFADTAMRAVAAERSVTLATTLAKVAETIERKDAGILVTDFTSNKSVLQRMINALKQLLPELVTIVASDGRDTSDMIGLINHGQVFRYLLKPLQEKNLMYEINAASIRHLELVQSPDLAVRHQVSKMRNFENPDDTLNQFVSRIRRIRTGFGDPTDSST